MSNCIPCPPCELEEPLTCEPYGTVSVANRIVVEDDAFCTKTLSSPSNQSFLVWRNGVAWAEKIGYLSGGTVSQTGSKTNSVTLNKFTGSIVTHFSQLNADTTISFTLNNTTIEQNDIVIVSHVSGGTLGAYGITASPTGNAATISIRNLTSAALSEAITIRFIVFKSSNS